MKCLVVEDDLEISGIIEKTLAAVEIQADIQKSGRDALECAMAQSYELIILDLMIPDLDGFGFLNAIRDKGITTPVLISSALSDLSDRIKGLTLGGDDYLTKPFASSELQMRATNLIRRSKNISGTTQVFFQDLRLNRLRRETVRAGKKIELHDREFILLDLLMSNNDKILSKKTILKEVWNYDFDPQTNVVDVLVCRLREKIERGFESKLIHTVRGIGYTMRGATSRSESLRIEI